MAAQEEKSVGEKYVKVVTVLPPKNKTSNLGYSKQSRDRQTIEGQRAFIIRAYCVNTKLKERPEARQTHNAGFAHVHIFHFWALIANTCTDIHNQFSEKALRVE